MPAYNEFPLQMELAKSMRDLPEFTWGRWCRVVLRSNRGYRDGNWFSGTQSYTIMYKVDKSWFGFLSRLEIESQIYSHLLCTWWCKSRSGFQSFLWIPGMWIMATGFWSCNLVRNSCLSANGKVKRCAMKRALIVTWAFIPSANHLRFAPNLSLKDPIYPTSLGCVPLPIGDSKIESPVRKNYEQPLSSFWVLNLALHPVVLPRMWQWLNPTQCAKDGLFVKLVLSVFFS